ncbi:MAG: sugar phosphate isomerase/epimerase [Phycisphaerae bacterium]|nr:sugar phosphate isomerase/epimerase [Phycisphaerae bacterium]
MKVAMMSYTLARGAWGKTRDVAELCRLAGELGLDGVDWVTTYDHDPREIRRITDDHGLRNVCYTFSTRMHSADAKERQAALDALAPELEIGRTLGADKVMIVIGGLPGVTRQEGKARAMEGLSLAVSIGKEVGMTVTIEHFPGAASAFCTSADMNEAVAAVPGLKITYDNGNLLTGGEDPAVGFRDSAEHIVHAHFKDWVLSDDGLEGLDGRRYMGALVGEGIVHPEPCILAMREAGYEGYIDFEYEGHEYTPEEAMRRGVPRLREMIAAFS